MSNDPLTLPQAAGLLKAIILCLAMLILSAWGLNR
jgi:hypothetical protein